MAFVEDIVKTEPAAAIGFGVLVLAFPFLFPGLRSQWAEAVKGGAKLFFEAEGGAEGEIMDRLADAAVDDVVKDLSQGSKEERRQAATADIRKFKALARRRSDRHGWDDQDREARYDRHLGKLRVAISGLRATQTGTNAEVLDELVERLETV